MDALTLANALEKFASHIDENEGTRQRDQRASSLARVEKIAEQYRAIYGVELPAADREKIASLDAAGLDVVEKLAAAGAAPESLGSAASSSPFPASPGSADPLAEFAHVYSGSAR